MNRKLVIAGATLAALVASLVVSARPAQAATGLRISGGRLVEANGTPFVMRGVSHAHVWYPSRTSSFADIKSLGANTVRVVLGSGQRWGPTPAGEVAAIVSLCKQNRLICVLEAHDTTGYGEDSAAATLDQAVSYWISVQSALAGQENYIVINLGNEPYGNNQSVSAGWTTATADAVKRMRAAGFQHTLMVDAPMWGQDWQFIMRDNAATVFAADPDRNTLFSIHMYGVFDTAAEITDYLGRFRSAGLPVVVGEFGNMHSDGDPDEDTIMSYTQANGIGYLGWSWSGNSGGVEYLDMVTDFDVNRLTPWGQRIFNGADGIRSTSREATVYGGTPPPTPSTTPSRTPTPTPTPIPTPTGTRGCTASYAAQGQWPGGFQGDVTVTAGSAAITGWAVTLTFANSQTISSMWNATPTTNGATVTARNMSYNGNLAAGAGTRFGFTGTWNGTNKPPAVTCAAS